MSHKLCICVDCEDARRDAARFRFLEKNMTFYNTAESQKPVLAEVSARIWYHATDSREYPLADMIDATTRTSGVAHD